MFLLHPEEQASQYREDTAATITAKPELEDSTSSGDVPKSKLYSRTEAKRLDLECPIAGPGRRRNVSPSAAAEEEEHMDLKICITDREKQGVKSDAFITYKICTEVSSAFIIPSTTIYTGNADNSLCIGLFCMYS